MEHHKTIEQVQNEYTDEWMKIHGIEGTAIGIYKGKPCITVFSSIDAQKLQNRIPVIVEGYPVVIELTGKFHSFENE